MKSIFTLIALFILAVNCKEWDIMNTGIPIAYGLGAERLWIVSDHSFNCLDMNSSFIWRVAAGEKIIQSEIVKGKGIVYLSRQNDISKLGLRSLENGGLKWETQIGTVSKFTCNDLINLDDSTSIGFDGVKQQGKSSSLKSGEKDSIQATKDALIIGSLKVKYNKAEFGEPILYELLDSYLIVSTKSGSTLFYKNSELIWTRDESLSKVVASKFVKVGDENRWVTITELGTIVALDAETGSRKWRLFFNDGNFKFIKVYESFEKTMLIVCSLKECIEINPESGKYEYILKDGDLEFVSSIETRIGDFRQQFLVMVDSGLKISIYPNTTEINESYRNSTIYFYMGLEKGSREIVGYEVEPDSETIGRYNSKQKWTINLPDSEVIIAASKNKENGKSLQVILGPIASLGRVLGDRSVLYKYLNPNLIAFMTESKIPDSNSLALTFYLVDAVSGAIHYRAIHPAGGPIYGKDSSVQILLSENLAVYTYWNHGVEKGKEYLKDSFINETIPNNKGMEVVVLELYESEKPDKKIPGTNFSSFSSFSPAVISGAFMFPFPIQSIGITRTLSGITSKQILFGLSSGQVYGVGRKILDPRRPLELTSNDKEEELVPYTPLIEYQPLNSVTRQNFVSGKWMESFPLHLESSSLVIVGDLDIVCRIIHPSSNFDILSDDFNHLNLIGTIVLLASLTIAARLAVDKKQLNNAWR